jgi:cytochrome oxidase Cu insertion factor (SCO1/SenC/PrrC family)
MSYKRLIILALVGVSTGLGILLALYKFQEPKGVVYKETTSSEAGGSDQSIGGDFILVDHNGNPRSTSEFRGKILLIYFGYTYCPDVCPMALEHMTKALQMLGKDRDKIAILFVSVDPTRDTCEVLRLYSTNFDPNIIMLTGTENALQEAMSKYRVYAKKEAKEGFSDYLINHTSVVYVMSQNGSYITSFAHSTAPEKIQEILFKQLREGNWK